MIRDYRAEARGVLQSYLKGRTSVGALLSWEGSLSLDDTVPVDLRGALDEIALLGDEVLDGVRDEADLKTRVERYLNEAPRIDVTVSWTGTSTPTVVETLRRPGATDTTQLRLETAI
jgi:hypothetical protein